MLGYSRKDPAKRLLEKSFKENIDYKIEKAAPPQGGAASKTGGSGLNKELIMLNINTFKIQKGKYDLKIIKYNY